MEMIRIGGEYVARQNNHIDHRISDAAVTELERCCPPLAALTDHRIRAGAKVYGRQLMDLPRETVGREAVEELADYVVYTMFRLDGELTRPVAERMWKLAAPVLADLYLLATWGDDG